MAYFLQLGKPGKNQIVGKSREKHHVGWIELISFDRPPQSQTPLNKAGGRETPTGLDDFTCTRSTGDHLTSALFLAASAGKHFESAVLSITAPQGHWISRTVLDDVMLTSFHVRAVGAGKAYEVFSLTTFRLG